MVVRGNNIHEKNVLRFGIKASHLHFVTRKHPPGRERERNTQRESGEGELMPTLRKALSDIVAVPGEITSTGPTPSPVRSTPGFP